MSSPNSEEQFISTTLSQLSLEEKVALLSGSSFVAASGVPRLGIPNPNLLDSVNGVKSPSFESTSTLCFPSTSCLGATWNPRLLERMGKTLAGQAVEKGVSVILGPAVNIHRDPRGGRNFECFSEDPLVTGKLAAALINGIQDRGDVAACPKHFVGNESETKRRFYGVEADSRTLREIYLAAFQYLLRESTPKALMTAYNKIDGVYCSESPIIKDILRDEWGFKGCVMSDWFGTRSQLPALYAGLDLEMPGPSVFRGTPLVEEVKHGRVNMEVIDERVQRVLSLIHKTADSRGIGRPPVPQSELSDLARLVASEGIVLLKNKDSTLPLDFNSNARIAVIGAAAKDPPIGGGGSARVAPQYLQMPLDCIISACTDPSLVSFSIGCKNNCTIPEVELQSTCAKNSQPGIDVEYFVYGSSRAVLEEYLPSTKTTMLGFLKPPLTQETFSHFTVSTTITPKSSGKHTLAIQATGAFEFFVGEEMALVDDMQPPPSVEDFLFVPEALERKCWVQMEAGKPYAVKAVVQPYVPAEETGEPRVYSAKLCFEEAYSKDDLSLEAINKAKSSDVAIIFAGRNAEMESEGFDLDSIKLPEDQEQIISDVARASKKTVLVLYGGNPIDVSTYEHLVDVILFAHFPGQEGSQAITDILTGKVCPNGRLATSWPVKLEDVPTFNNFPAKQRIDGSWEIQYAEGLGIGYRADGYTPRYPLGFGLSYTEFRCTDLQLSWIESEESLAVDLCLANTGKIDGHEVVQVYISERRAVVSRPKKELKAFSKCWIEAGKMERVRMVIDKRTAFSWWDNRTIGGGERWRAEPGDFEVQVGGLSQNFVLEEGFCWRGL
ncbi:putative glycosyl hydrolase [Mollisia scopiformis]|uniref:beta-glucosidase n=1 Tax=Mollisia scopiformis TaxID=149040 RepID=A0A194XCD0_MOLSC|nr:putative glycosyl hydrolase [Mollisia scopiformis]KUJ17825.1 putative glycosyl hydrolase [Mollisia scopiformis]